MKPNLRRGLAAIPATLMLAAAVPASAADPLLPHTQSTVEALAQDAGEYARQNGVSVIEAMTRLRAQEDSVAATDEIADSFRHRLAGISIEHQPDYRIVVLLTGDEPVPDRFFRSGGSSVPIIFRTGAAATQEQVRNAISAHQGTIREAFPRAQGMGLDQRTGELVLMVQKSDADRHGAETIDGAVETLTGVPVRVRVLDRSDQNLAIEGGARVVGIDPANGRRYSCTTGFVVTDGARTGVVTAAHCPDALTYYDRDEGEVPLEFVGQWGARYQDVQVHVSDRAHRPSFYADSGKTADRPLTGWRNRASTRAGDAVCKRGETTGYSCSQVELTDFAPPGDLCGGPCDPTWVTVTGPNCRAGDSGGPIFSGTVAFGIVKGGSYLRGTCNFYYYMSTDFLPAGWRLLHARSAAPPPRRVSENPGESAP